MYNVGNANIITAIPHVHMSQLNNFQNTNSPDIDFDRDITSPEIALGMEATELSSDKRYRVNLSTIIMSALIFLAILAWFDFLQTAFYTWLSPQTQTDQVAASVKLWYAFLVTILVFILVFLIYYHARDHIR